MEFSPTPAEEWSPRWAKGIGPGWSRNAHPTPVTSANGSVSKMDLDQARAFAGENHRAVLSTTRADGRPQLSPVTCSTHPDGAVEISSRATAYKVRNLQ